MLTLSSTMTRATVGVGSRMWCTATSTTMNNCHQQRRLTIMKMRYIVRYDRNDFNFTLFQPKRHLLTSSSSLKFIRLPQIINNNSSSGTLMMMQIRQINIAGEESLATVRDGKKFTNKHDYERSPSSSPPSSSSTGKKRSPFGYLFVLLPIATFCLGTWQIYRLRWKLDLIEKLEALITNEPTNVPENIFENGIESWNKLEYTKVRIGGHFDHTAMPLFIFPRPLLKPTSKSTTSAITTQKDSSGLFSTNANARNIGALTVLPFVVTEPTLVDAYNKYHNSDVKSFRILVNVGWVSRETMDSINRQYHDALSSSSTSQTNSLATVSSPPADIELIGVIRSGEQRKPFDVKNSVSSNTSSSMSYFNRRDLEKMSTISNTEPLFVDAHNSYEIPLMLFNAADTKTSKKPIITTIQPIGGQTRVNLRNEHLSYIITWYSLTGIFSYLWYKKIFKPRL